MKLRNYLQRIGYRGGTEPSMDALTGLLRCHVLSVPFENLDTQLGTPLTTDVDAAFEKIVERRRGGWCYEQNGVFGWALSEIGFGVTRVAAAVRRSERGDKALANHLCLLVDLPGEKTRYLADVGFGGSMIHPIPLVEREHDQPPYQLSLHRLEDGHWQFREVAGADAVSYDFLPEPGNEDALSKKCAQLQTDPESSFVLSFVAQKRRPDSHLSLRGRVFAKTSSSGKDSRTIESADEFAEILRSTFRLDVDGAADLWPKIVARHEALFGE